MINKSLYFHHLVDGPNIAKGSSSLKILGEKMSAVDFLVREAIQNSSDACFRDRKDGKTFVCIDFDTGEFKSKDFNALFNTEVKSTLDSRYPTGKYKWIAISDFNCEGLNGAVRPNDPSIRSNFCRLICDSGEAQDKEGSGGCWGYGKSVYYRIGIGIVIFYSRFLGDDGKYHSRLIIKLAEDEKSSGALLRAAGYKKSAGIAWWCKEVKDGWVYPIEDDDTITSILDIFGIRKYEEEVNNEHGNALLTGTKIIIPYFDPDKVCEGLLPKMESGDGLTSDQKKQVESLVHDIPTSLRFSSLRWYSSRMGNSWLNVYNKCETNARARIPMLKVNVQGSPVNVEDSSTPDFFIAVQDLYNKALYEAAKSYWPHVELKPPKPRALKSINQTECSIKNYIRPTKAGWIVHSVFKPENAATPDPYILTNKYSTLEGDRPPMMFFMREPGMVIDYSIGDEWLKNVGSSDKKDEYVVALFYPNVKAVLRDEVGDNFPKFVGKNLGFYLRSCEEAEHSTWTEPSGIRIVERIRVNCASKLAKIYSKSVTPSDGHVGLLANYLSNRLMRGPKRGGSGGNGGGNKHSSMNILAVDSSKPGVIVVKYNLHILKADPRVRVTLQLLLDSGYTDVDKWESEDSQYDGPFPIRMSSFYVEKLCKGAEDIRVCDDLLDFKGDQFEIECELDNHEAVFGNGPRDHDMDIYGHIIVHADDPMYRFRFRAKSEEVKNG